MRQLKYIVLFCVITQLQTKIIESDRLSDVNQFVDKDSIVLFDIDETLARTPNYAGSSIWVNYNIKKLQEKGLSFQVALDDILYIFFTIHNVINMLPVANSPQIVENLQKKGAYVMGLTSRSIPIMKRTIQQLAQLGIDFSKSTVYDKSLDLVDAYVGKLYKAVIFTGSNNKGKMLFLLFDKIGYKPKKIIFVDDKLKNVQDVEREAKKHGIEYVGIRFSKLDNWRDRFDPAVAKKQLHEFKVNVGLLPIKKTPSKLPIDHIEPKLTPIILKEKNGKKRCSKALQRNRNTIKKKVPRPNLMQSVCMVDARGLNQEKKV